tara:strand:+ start:658 stop:1065 length:408 start_codon:yes stop_codon:yes gene_type:complete
MLLISLLKPLQAEEKYTELKQGEPAPYAGILLTRESIAKIYADQESEIAKLKIDHEYQLNTNKLTAKTKYDLLDTRYKLDIDMYQVMISNRDNTIQNMPLYDKSYKSDWSMIGGFVLGSVITVGIVYSVDQLHNH